MTREEIIKHLHEALDYVSIHFPYRYVFVEAIEALSQPSLSDLGEAAEEYSLDVKAKPYGNLVKEAFKSGATWRDAQIPSLPSNLDEAAEDSWAVYEYRESPKGLYSTCYVDGFKAGAEWMAGQGETLNSLIWRDEDDKLFIDAFVDENKFKMAENVTIQVRKKK